MLKTFLAVKQFRRSGQQHVGCYPTFPPNKVQTQALALIKEEVDELEAAIEDQDLVEIADALCDIVFTTLGAAVAYGLPMALMMDEVVRTNMLKVSNGVVKDALGKICKPEGWEPPKLRTIINLARGERNRPPI